jgi:hypothetical protein
MSKDVIYSIASECEETQEQRANLQQKLEDLKKSKEILDFQACETRTSKLYNRMKRLGVNSHEAKYNPTRAQESSPGPSDKEPSRPHTRTPKVEVLDFKDHSGKLSHVSNR